MSNPKGVAPICNAPPEQPQFISKPPVFFRFTPPTADIPSLTQAVLHLQQAVQALTNQSPPPNNTVPGFPAGQSGAGGGGGVPGFGRGGGGQPQEDNNWTERSRQTENVKVVNPDDDSQFIIVKEITSITFERISTGEIITIKRDPR